MLLFTAADFTSTTSHIHNWMLFLLCSVSSLFLELFLHWSPVAYWARTNVGSSSFCLFIFFMGISGQEYWSGLPFPSPVDHVLSELSTMTRPSWVAPHGMAYSFIELDKAMVHVIRLVSFLCSVIVVFSLSSLWWKKISFLMRETDWGENWILFWWAGPCSLPVIWPKAKLWWR